MTTNSDTAATAVAPSAGATKRDHLFESPILKGILHESRRILESRIRPPAGVIPFRWSASDRDAHTFDLNELLPLIAAWQLLDPSVARDLLRSAFSAQADDGSLPRALAPTGAVAESEAPWPVLAQCVLSVHLVEPDATFLEEMQPKLLRYLQWAFNRFDPEGEGRPHWPAAAEALTPETWDTDLLSADLSALLLAETDALTRLEAAPDMLAPLRVQAQRFADELRAFFWDLGGQVYRDRYRDGRFVNRRTFSALMPLIWSGLPALSAAEASKLLAAGGPFGPPSAGVPLWEYWPDDPEPPPAPPAHQALLLLGLQLAERWRLLRALRERLASGIEAAAGRRRLPPTSLYGEKPLTAEIAAATAAALAIVALTDPPPLRARDGGRRWLKRLDTNRGLLAAGLALMLIGGGMWVIRWWQTRRTPPGPSLEALVGLAHNKYRRGDYEEAQRMCREIVEYWGANTAPSVRFLFGNILFRDQQYAAAMEQYSLAAKDLEIGPIAEFNRAQALVRLGRRDEAISIFERLAEEQKEIFPELAQRARLAGDFLKGRISFPDEP